MHSLSAKARALVLDPLPEGMDRLAAALEGEEVVLARVATLQEALDALDLEPPELVLVVDRGEPPPVARLAQAAPRAWVEVIGPEELTPTDARLHQLVRRAALRRRVRAELVSEDHLTRLEEVGSNMPGALFQVVLEADGSLYFPFISRSIEALTGAPVEALISDPSRVFAAIHPDDVQGFQESQEHATRTLGTWDHEFRIVPLSGEMRWLRGSATPQPQVDGSMLWNGVVLDVTERVEAVKALEHERSFLTAVLDTVAALVLVLDTEGRIVGFNRACEQLTGWSAAEVRGRKAFDALLDPEDHQRATDHFSAILEGSVGSGLECRWRTRAGGHRVVSCQSTVLRREDGSTEFIIETGVDITGQRELEDATSRVARLESLGVLAGGIAHDFNNLLMGVAGHISLAQRYATSNPELHLALRQGMVACRQATDLASQLLTFATGGEPMKRRIDLGALVREVATFSLRGTRVRADLDLPEGLWWAEVDRGQLSQAIHNLVLNALQAMPHGGTVTIESANVTIGAAWNEGSRPLEPGRYVRVAIADEGGGIEPEHLDRLFDPWFTTKEEGSGLGLAVAHSVVVRHGGAITVDSVAGEGSTFRIYLPGVDPEEEPALVSTRAVLPVAPGRRVLVMDDESLVREVVGEMLSLLGHEVAYAIDGSEALASYEEARIHGRPYHAVIMDLTIPGGMGGREAMRRLQELDPSAVVIASSGYANDGTLASFAEEGFRAVLPKPYQVRDLARVLGEVLG